MSGLRTHVPTGMGFSHHFNKSIECQSEAGERIARSYQSRGLRRGKKIKVQTQGWNKINVYDYSPAGSMLAQVQC